MASPNPSVEKICVICHKDCASRPRVKDRAGHYYCKACYARAEKDLAARKKTAARKKDTAAVPAPPEPPVEPPPMDDDLDVFAVAPDEAAEPADDGLDALAEAAASAANAAPVEVARPAPTVEALPPTLGPPEPRPKRERSVGIPDALKQPWVAFVLPVLVLGLLFIPARSSEGPALLFLFLQAIFALAVGVIVLVQAFREGIATGFLCLCVPFYALYFVFLVNENPYVKALFGASILTSIAGFTLDPSLTDPSAVPTGY